MCCCSGVPPSGCGCLVDWQFRFTPGPGSIGSPCFFEERPRVWVDVFRHRNIGVGSGVCGVDNVLGVALKSETSSFPSIGGGNYRYEVGTGFGPDVSVTLYETVDGGVGFHIPGNLTFESCSENVDIIHTGVLNLGLCSGILDLTAVPAHTWTCPSSIPPNIWVNLDGVFESGRHVQCLAGCLTSGNIELLRDADHTTWHRVVRTAGVQGVDIGAHFTQSGIVVTVLSSLDGGSSSPGEAQHRFTNYAVGDICGTKSFVLNHESTYGGFPGPSSCCVVVGNPILSGVF